MMQLKKLKQLWKVCCSNSCWKIVSNVEVRDVFKVSKVGTVAGCMVLDGKLPETQKYALFGWYCDIQRHLSSMKRFKDDVRKWQMVMNVDLALKTLMISK